MFRIISCATLICTAPANNFGTILSGNLNQTQYAAGSNITYACDDNTCGTRTATCTVTNNGFPVSFTSPFGSCVPKYCNPPALNGLVQLVSQGTVVHGSSHVVRCPAGYEMIGADGSVIDSNSVNIVCDTTELTDICTDVNDACCSTTMQVDVTCRELSSECTCENGIKVENANCILPGGNQCVSCIGNYHLVDRSCVANVCRCENGIKVEDTDCTSNGVNQCQSCIGNFNLSSGKTCVTKTQEILKVKEELEDVFDNMVVLSGDIRSSGSFNPSATKELIEKSTDFLKEATDRLEELQKLAGEVNSADQISSSFDNQRTNLNVTNRQIISDSLEIFEKILINAPPNITFTSKNELMAVVTVPTEPSIENPLEGQVLNLEKSDQLTEIEDDLGFYNYESLLGTDLVVVVPASVIDQNLIKSGDCPTPVVFTEIRSNILQPKSSTKTLAFTSIIVETCDDAANAELSAPVTLQFKKVYSNKFSTGENNSTGPNLSTPTYSKVECVFFNTSTLSWETQEEAFVSDDPTGETFTSIAIFHLKKNLIFKKII